MKIEITPEMRRFNRAVERADDLLCGIADNLPVEWLIEGLTAEEHFGAAQELEAAAKAISPQSRGE